MNFIYLFSHYKLFRARGIWQIMFIYDKFKTAKLPISVLKIKKIQNICNMKVDQKKKENKNVY